MTNSEPTQTQESTATTDDERMGLPTASPWFRYQLCAASYQLGEEAKKLHQVPPPTEAAGSGQRIHGALEGQAKFLASKSANELERLFSDLPAPVIHREVRLWICATKNKRRLVSGRADLIAISGKRAVIQDFKAGFMEPEAAETNPQLKVLAVALALENPFLEEIICQIIPGGHAVTETRYDKAKLAIAWREVMATLKAILDERAAFNPGVEQCRFCPAILICKAVRQVAWKVARYQITTLPADPERVGQILDECVLMKRLADSIHEHYYAKAVDNPEFKITGWALAPGSNVRELVNAHEARGKLEAFIDPAAFDALANYSVLELDRLVGRRFKLRGKAASAKLAEILGETLSFKQNKPTLKRSGEIIQKLPESDNGQ
jgi:hypothetical protein